MAKELQQMQPGEWADTTMFWVLRDMALASIKNPDGQGLEQARQYLNSMEKLQQSMIDDSGAGASALFYLRKNVVPHYEDIKHLTQLSKQDPVAAYEESAAIAGMLAENLDPALHEDFGWILYRYLKARLDELPSSEAGTLLDNYLKLKNTRPSMLHSMMLNFALRFAKSHPDFIFHNFFESWGISNFRFEDLNDKSHNGESIPSLISRVCAQLYMDDRPSVEEMSRGTGLAISEITDMYRKQWFWELYELQDSGNTEDFWGTISTYVNKFGTYPATEWHSKILRLAINMAAPEHVKPFIDMACGCRKAGLRREDWLPEIGKDGNPYPSLALRLAKKCHELIKKQPFYQKNEDLCRMLAGLYDRIEEQGAGDEWSARERAGISIWLGDRDDALQRYRDLLKHMGDKFFIWQEMAQCTDRPLLRIGLLLHALELEKSEDLTGPLRLETAEALIESGYTTEVEQLLDAYANHRLKKYKTCSEKWAVLREKAENMTEKKSLDKKKAIADALDYVYSDYPLKDYAIVGQFTFKGKAKTAFTDGNVTFTASPGRFGLDGQTALGTIVKIRCLIEKDRITPLTVQLTDAPKWSILPEQFGYVVYVNKENSAVSIITSQSEEIFFIDRKNIFKAGDFVTFRCYKRKNRKGDTVVTVTNPSICVRENALSHFRQRIVAVDDVNPRKQLFHIVMGAGKVSGIIRFNKTDLRPEVGDFLKLTYCIDKNNKNGRKYIVTLDLQPTDETNEELIKDIEGWLELKYKREHLTADYGFVDGAYVPKYILEKEGIENECTVKAKAVLGDNGKWKVFKLEEI